MIKKIDIYIIRKFLSTFFFAIGLIVLLAVIFDISEKLDDFIEYEVTLNEIIFEYYINFIPYFANLFSSLFTFIAVIFFTSRMAYRSEIVAILSSGVSYYRILVPYLFSALLITLLGLGLNNYVIPPANKKRLEFEEKIRNEFQYTERHIHKQLLPGLYFYLERYDNNRDFGERFTLEKYEEGKLVSMLTGRSIKWDSTHSKWTVNFYAIRDIDGRGERLRTGDKLDTTLNITPEIFSRRDNYIETMNFDELNQFIDEQKLHGSPINRLLIEKYQRMINPISTFILTLIGFALASRKVRGGIGLHIGLGISLSFVFILFMRFSSTFAIEGDLPPMVAVWIPNVVFGIVAFVLIRFAQK